MSVFCTAVVEPASSLALQQMLYYNTMYSAIHTVFLIGVTAWKVCYRSLDAPSAFPNSTVDDR